GRSPVSPLQSDIWPVDATNYHNPSMSRQALCWALAWQSPHSPGLSHYFSVAKYSRPMTSKCCCPFSVTCILLQPWYSTSESIWWLSGLFWMCCVPWAQPLTPVTKPKRVTVPKRNVVLLPPVQAPVPQEATMTIDAVFLFIMGGLFAAAIYLIMDRTLTRILFGLMLFTNAANLLIIIMAGPAGLPPIVSNGVAADEYFDPLPQALTLTSIVISFATTAFLLALIYRSWVLARRDEVQVDIEDIQVAEQPTYDAEEDAEITEEESEFLEDHEDPNIDYELTTQESPVVRPNERKAGGRR